MKGFASTQNPPSRVRRANEPQLRLVFSSFTAFLLNAYLKANHVPTVIVSIQLDRICGLKSLLSPKKVPAATMAKPIQSPQTTPQSRATSSWPNKGGKEIAIKIATGIKNPPGKPLSFSEKGFRYCSQLASFVPSPAQLIHTSTT